MTHLPLRSMFLLGWLLGSAIGCVSEVFEAPELAAETDAGACPVEPSTCDAVPASCGPVECPEAMPHAMACSGHAPTWCAFTGAACGCARLVCCTEAP